MVFSATLVFPAAVFSATWRHYLYFPLARWRSLGLGVGVGLSSLALLAGSAGANPEEFAPATPRLQVNYTGSSGGYRGFGAIDGWLPVGQQPGAQVTFVTGQVRLDTDLRWGSALHLGHRFQRQNLLLGGYLGADWRSTGPSTFTQLGAGLEAMGPTWGVYLNGYLPVGDSRQLVAGSGGTTLQNLRFEGNRLLADIGGFNQFETALAGVDLRSELQLWDLGNSGGAVWGTAGLGYTGGPQLAGTLGGRLGLEYRRQSNLRLGVGVETGDRFGTSATFFASYGFGGASPRPSALLTPDQRLWARATAPLQRQPTILVATQTEGTAVQFAVAAQDASGNDYIFRHVNPATGTIDGAEAEIATPRNTLAGALAVANGGDLVFVRAGNAGGAAAIPDGVQVYSEFAAVTLPSRNFGTVTLPGSGTGQRPTLGGAVTLGNNTLLDGFAFSGLAGAAILGQNVDNLTLRNNLVQNTVTTAPQPAAIALINVGGTVDISNNTVTGTTGPAFNAITNPLGLWRIQATGIGVLTNRDLANLTIANNTLANNTGNAIAVGLLGAGQAAQITIAGNSVQNSGIIEGGNPRGDGIQVAGADTYTVNQLTITTNTTANNQDEGIDITFINASRLNSALVQGNQISANSGDGLGLRAQGGSRMVLNVRANTVVGANVSAIAPGSTLCLGFAGNSVAQASTFDGTGGSLALVGGQAGVLATNTFAVAPTFTNVVDLASLAACPP